MQRRLLATAFLVALLAACDVPTGRAFSDSFPEVVLDEDFDVVMETVPVTLYDATGLVEALDVLPAEANNFGPGIEVDPARPRIAIVRWGGGSCLDRVRIALSTAEPAGYAIEIEEQEPMFMFGCAGVGISRGVVITFSEEVSANDFLLSVDPT